ncbi:MAG TPA: hypothetical protein VGN72_22535 [Tepidisphaeraceae bacterium]|jgi:hypothetical protein|nr:hypothetical protein [Tepidisphaeraceae bacterium]
MAKTKPAATQAERNKRQGDRCWKGYEPTPGKKPGTKGSCKPTDATKKAKSKSKSKSKSK